VLDSIALVLLHDRETLGLVAVIEARARLRVFSFL
jgi:hypothetical protein